MSRLAEHLFDTAKSGVYRVANEREVRAALRHSGFDLAPVQLDGTQGRKALLAAFARSLAFPDWFGGNWDALEDCLGDLSWRKAPGRVLLIEGGPDLAAHCAEDFGVLCDILACCARSWAPRRQPFFAVFLDPLAQLPLPALGEHEPAQ